MASGIRLREEIRLLVPLPGTGLLLAATRQTRPAAPVLYALDATTLATVWEQTADRTLYRAVAIGPDRLELHGDPGPTVVVLEFGQPTDPRLTVSNRATGLDRSASVSTHGVAALARDGGVVLGD